jgi:arsenite transporter
MVGLVADVGDRPEALVVPALVALLTLIFAGFDPATWRSQIRPHRRVAASSLGLNFVWAPLAAGILGWLFLAGTPDLRIGLVMLLVTPCTDWYLVFTAAARGNVALAAALLPVNLVLQLALLPVFVVVLAGAATDVAFGDLVASVVVVLAVPVVVAVVVRATAARTGTTDRLGEVLDRLEPLGLALLAVAVAAIFATHGRTVVDEPTVLLRLLVPLAVFFAGSFWLAAAVARIGGFAHRERVTLTMTAMARNSPVALAVAAAAFPDRPLVALALVVGPLVELPVLALAARVLTRGDRTPAPPGPPRGGVR